MNKNMELSRKIGRNFSQFCQFIGWVKMGKKAICFGSGYVVLSQNAYDALIKKQASEVSQGWVDEAVEIPEESYARIVARED